MKQKVANGAIESSAIIIRAYATLLQLMDFIQYKNVFVVICFCLLAYSYYVFLLFLSSSLFLSE